MSRPRLDRGLALDDPRLPDPAVGGVAAVAAAYLWTFFQLTDVVGGTVRVAVAVAVAGLCGLLLARVAGPRTALWLAALLLVGGLAGYYLAIPASRRAVFSVRNVTLDALALSTGLSVLRLALADVWLLATAPVPTFLVGYFAGRGRHVAAASVAGGTLGFFLLTGDAGDAAVLAGVAGVALAVGLATLSTPGRRRGHADTVAVVVAAMLVASATVAAAPAGAATPIGLDRGTSTLESTLNGGDELRVVGTTRLSPEVRFTVESPVERNWHTGAYDTYTGDGWVRTGERSALDAPLDGPPGDAERVAVDVTAEAETTAVPAPWKAVDVSGIGDGAVRVDERGSVRLAAALRPGDEVTVESRVIDPEPAALRNASADYPAEIEARHTQLPESTPDRVGERTAAIVAAADADSPAGKAAAIESYLRSEYAYSLTVERPDGDVADAFLFEMDAGYCVYFATTMAVMLRSQGIPARLETGYTTGEPVGDDRYVVRGQNAHAWTSVYVPDHGWVAFDPTPSAERDAVRSARLAEARADGAPDVDTPASETDAALPAAGTPGGVTAGNDTEPTASETAGNATDADGTEGGRAAPGEFPRVDPTTPDPGDVEGEEAATGPRPWLPDRETAAYWLLVGAVVVVAARRTGLTARAARRVRPYAPRRRRGPAADAKRAFADLELLFARRYRGRRPGETPRAYVDALRSSGADARAETVLDAYERAAYAGSVSRAEADAARRTVRRLALESWPFVGRLVR